MSDAAHPASPPKHRLVSDALSHDIRGGRYQVGDRLPSESELSLRYGVSRHTVRAALRTLNRLGLVAGQQGVGNIVRDTRLVSHYSHAFDSAQDLLQYATTTRVRVLDRTQVVIDAAMAEQFPCRRGEHWWRLRTVRSEPADGAVVACSEIYIPLAFGAVLDESSRSDQPVFALIEARLGLAIAEIRQDIVCVPAITALEARHLEVPAGSPAMQITRRYFSAGGRLLEVARSLHPGGVFKYSMRVQLRHGG